MEHKDPQGPKKPKNLSPLLDLAVPGSIVIGAVMFAQIAAAFLEDDPDYGFIGFVLITCVLLLAVFVRAIRAD